MPRKDLIQLRRGTAAEWTAANPILASGEEGHETDTGKRKIGNGTQTWNDLSYLFGGGSSSVTSVNGQNGVVTLVKGDIGLGNVDNTSDLNKPISTATQTALNAIQTDLDAKQDINLIDTKQNILETTADDGLIAISTDTNQEFYSRGGAWYESSAIYKVRSANPDMGLDLESSLSGYGEDYITDKAISNSTIGYNTNTTEGGIRTAYASSLGRNVAQFYLAGAWRTILSGINIVIDGAENVSDIEVTDFASPISLISGNSDALDLAGNPIVQNMKTDMGAYQSDLIINGGTF